MVRLLIAIAVGAVLAVVAGFTLSDALASAANGTASHASVYQYGTR